VRARRLAGQGGGYRVGLAPPAATVTGFAEGGNVIYIYAQLQHVIRLWFSARVVRNPICGRYSHARRMFGIARSCNPLLSCLVHRLRVFIRYWLPALVWMGMIFAGSSDQGSFPRSSRIIGPILRWLFPHLSDEIIHATVVTVRKFAHLGEYAVLAVLLSHALRKPRWGEARPWDWSQAGRALALTALYAASDEFHQLFVPSRGASVWDVMLDTVGGAVGLVCLWAVVRWRRRWR
jgi:VanZ family protein